MIYNYIFINILKNTNDITRKYEFMKNSLDYNIKILFYTY